MPRQTTAMTPLMCKKYSATKKQRYAAARVIVISDKASLKMIRIQWTIIIPKTIPNNAPPNVIFKNVTR